MKTLTDHLGHDEDHEDPNEDDSPFLFVYAWQRWNSLSLDLVMDVQTSMTVRQIVEELWVSQVFNWLL